MKYDLVDNYYIKKADKYNFTLCKTNINKETGEEYDVSIGFYPTLSVAWRGAVRKLALSADTNEELVDIIKRLEELELKI